MSNLFRGISPYKTGGYKGIDPKQNHIVSQNQQQHPPSHLRNNNGGDHNIKYVPKVSVETAMDAALAALSVGVKSPAKGQSPFQQPTMSSVTGTANYRSQRMPEPHSSQPQLAANPIDSDLDYASVYSPQSNNNNTSKSEDRPNKRNRRIGRRESRYTSGNIIIKHLFGYVTVNYLLFCGIQESN